MRSLFHRQNNKKITDVRTWRVRLIFLFIFIFSVFLVKEFVSLQVLKGDFYRLVADDNHQLKKKITPERGSILMQEKNSKSYFPVAINAKVYNIVVDPRKIPEDKREEVVSFLTEKLDIEQNEVQKKVDKIEDPYEVIAKNIEEEPALEIENKKFAGVYLEPGDKRFYPEGSLAAQVIGFMGIKDQDYTGQYGLEQYYNLELTGEKGQIVGEKDTRGNWIATGDRSIEEARDGDDLVLTIDRSVQYTVEEKLKAKIEELGAEKGSIIVMDPMDGGIIAMANSPSFDPNNYNQVEDPKLFLNSAIHSTYEPGSIFKPITMASAIDTGKVLPSTIYFDTGFYQTRDFAERPIKNDQGKSYGESTMTQVLEKSLNTGAIFAMNRMGKETFAQYVKDFGFGETTGIDLMGEHKGNISSLDNLRGDVNFATAAFGQGITVTPLEMASAVSAIANGGELIRPHVIEKIIASDGKEKIPEITKKRVLKEDTSKKITSMLVSVVENGLSRPAKIEGYNIAGKTGTAQIPDKINGGYLQDETIQSFVGYFPAYEPEFLVLIKLDKPKVSYSLESTVPLFKDLAEYLIGYYDLPPDY